MNYPFTVSYRDKEHRLRDFCTYAQNETDARLQALECYEELLLNPNAIERITREQNDHPDFLDW